MQIIDLYHEVLPELPRIKKERWPGSPDERALRARWREDHRHQSLDFWRMYFQAVRTSDWHMGIITDWRANLRWLVKRTNFDKMVERFINNGTWGEG